MSHAARWKKPKTTKALRTTSSYLRLRTAGAAGRDGIEGRAGEGADRAAGVEKLGEERVGGDERKLGEGWEKLGEERGDGDGRKLGEGWEKLGEERGDGWATLGAGRNEGVDCEKLGGDERTGGDGDGVGDDRIGGCCCAKPELGGARKVGAGVGVATLGALDVPNERDDERASKPDGE